MHRNHNRNVEFFEAYKRRLGQMNINQSDNSSVRNSNSKWDQNSGRLNLQTKPNVPRNPALSWQNGIHPNPSLVEFRNNLPVAQKRHHIIDSINNCPGKIMVTLAGT